MLDFLLFKIFDATPKIPSRLVIWEHLSLTNPYATPIGDWCVLKLKTNRMEILP